MNKNSLSELSKKYNILLLRNNYLPNESFLKKKIYGFNKNDIILCSTAHILSENDLRIRNIILNFHEAPLPKFRGSALYYHLVLKKVKLFRTSIIQPVDLIDAGKIELKSKNFNIQKFNVFKVLLLGYMAQSQLIFKIIGKKITKIKKNFKPNDKFEPYTIPTRVDEKNLNKQKKNIKYSDLLFFIYLLSYDFKNVKQRIKKFIRF